ncbi:hypothetical protein H5183_00890 [Pseudoalteromonas sp. SR44-8]|uniref:hypothetical protein n=1 Tax=Pseudoalteromonas sp. SR44-8 TaxID=2760933 RepID=UPI0015FFDF8F|nr:hypothetical protein [Pseudoalteromonas sp. SR44-8]MBB1299878.1 hypothetical protein [Pseudoalteromonas sp. SR44-8]
MKIYKCFLLFLTFSINAASTSDWEAKIIKNVANADSVNCIQYPDFQDLDSQFLCQELLLKISKSLYENWANSSSEKARLKLIASWWSSEEITSLKNPYIKLHLAALLGRNRQSELSEQREYARRYLYSDNVLIQGGALTAIRWVGNCEDVKDIVDIIKTEREGIAEQAVLTFMGLLRCQDMENILLKIYGDVNRVALKQFIEKKLSMIQM